MILPGSSIALVPKIASPFVPCSKASSFDLLFLYRFNCSRDGTGPGRLDHQIPSIRRFRITKAENGPILCHHNRTVSWLMSMPGSDSRSTTIRSVNGKRVYFMTGAG